MSIDMVPKNLRGLRACLYCSLIKSIEQFQESGCDNCENFLRLRGDHDKVYQCTSANFDGMIAAMDPENSWVCKWQRINRKHKGLYAVSVSGNLPSSLITELKSMGVHYRPQMRDTTTK